MTLPHIVNCQFDEKSDIYRMISENKTNHESNRYRRGLYGMEKVDYCPSECLCLSEIQVFSVFINTYYVCLC